MKLDDFRSRLIDGTIHVIAESGLDKASTKRIGQATSINEAYIYRFFKDKEDMFAKVFVSLDEELATKVLENLNVMYMQELTFESRCRSLFFLLWDFLMGNRDKCLTYVRYYYSPYFLKYSLEAHKKRFAPVVETIKSAFIDEADVWMILSHILNVMLDFSVKVYNNEMPEEDNYPEHVFRVIYRSVEQYFIK